MARRLIAGIIAILLVVSVWAFWITLFPPVQHSESIIRVRTSEGAPNTDLQMLVSGNTAFALDVYHAMSGSNANLFISPYSISSALAMAYAGARNETAREMAQTLRFTLPDGRLHAAFNNLNAHIGNDPEKKAGKEENGFRLTMANSFWGQKGYPFLGGFLDVLQKEYNTDVKQVDFARDSEQARKAVNDWTSQQTEGKIPEILSPGSTSSQTRLVIVNAVYFRNLWLDSFPKNWTRQKSFTLLDGKQVPVSMMMRRGVYAYTEGENYQAVEIQYRYGNTSMIVLLPQTGKFEVFEREMDSTRFQSILKGMAGKNPKMLLRLPRFTVKPEPVDLKNVLGSMGMREAFSSGADFSGINEEKSLHISGVFHSTFIRVDEVGTEAAAATAVMGEDGVPPVKFTADRPFIFLIYDRNTGSILFLGRVLNPDA